jgi:hypothetical protein
MFLTAQPRAHVRFRRAIERRALWLAEDAARELPELPLRTPSSSSISTPSEGSPKFEHDAMRGSSMMRCGARAVPDGGVAKASALRGGCREPCESRRRRGLN